MGMTMTQGSKPGSAVRILAEFGYTVKTLAGELGVSLSTIYRWRRGGGISAVNLSALKTLVHAVQAHELAAPFLKPATDRLLRSAVEACTTDADRAEEERLLERMRASLSSPSPVLVSITSKIDPFELCQPAGQLEIPF